MNIIDARARFRKEEKEEEKKEEKEEKKREELEKALWAKDLRNIAEECGIEEASKPPAKLVGTDGNIFSLIGTASRALRHAGHSEKAAEMRNRVMDTAKSYEEALQLILEYVTPM
jgi:hypothetical protein